MVIARGVEGLDNCKDGWEFANLACRSQRDQVTGQGSQCDVVQERAIAIEEVARPAFQSSENEGQTSTSIGMICRFEIIWVGSSVYQSTCGAQRRLSGTPL
jgi:hypothetical protein